MTDQTKLDIEALKKLETVEGYEFEPIKGYPMLKWTGKRPFTSTQYYPAQLKENHGEPVDGWMNRIYWGDNLQVLSHLLKEFRGKVDLVYIDPPFDSKANYKKEITIKGRIASNDHNSFEEKQYTDIWTNDEYLQFIYERLILIKELLSNSGSLYVHCDWRKNAYLRLILDEIFGSSNFLAEIKWKRVVSTGSSKSISKKYPVVDDTIFFYSKSASYTWNTQYSEFSEKYKKRFNQFDERGYFYWDNLKSYSKQRLDELIKDNRIKLPLIKGRNPRVKNYVHERKGVVIDNLWLDLIPVNSQAKEDTKYPTQKPESLLERIIQSSSNPGDLVLDCFMGSGTTQAVAMKFGRRFIGVDINLGAIQITTKRLLNQSRRLAQAKREEEYYRGFSVYTVNRYDIFRNELEAKEILTQALEIQPLPGNSMFDGEKDGRMVKIMPINRIATRADLNPLISNFNYKEFEKRKEQNPTKPVESLMIVCMGHEPDLKAALQKEVPYQLDVEVVDILRDKSKLEFKRDSESEVVLTGDVVEILQFYPMNLLQKLSIMKENVEDWREMVESVMIDFNYDGSVFEPSVVDVPDKNELVKGKYKTPDDSGTIRVKITDLLSESLEVDV